MKRHALTLLLLLVLLAPAAAQEIDFGWQERTVRGPDGVVRDWLLHVPVDYTPEQSYMLVVDMHGGVSRPVALTHAELGQMKFFWGKQAQQHGFMLAIPAGQLGAEWWTEVGAGNVLSVIDTVKREYNVDENRVFATGFSDGGSGSFYMALAHPTPFAGFIPLNGHPSVAQMGGLQGHMRNFLNKPLYAVNTENDSLYPSKTLKPFYDALAKLGASLVYRDLPGWSHNPMYLEGENGERPRIWEWMKSVRRDPRPKRVYWEGPDGAPCRVHWLAGVRVRETGSYTDRPDINPKLPPSRPRIGVQVDTAFEGPGVRVTVVVEDSPAAAAGLEPDDVIIRIGEVETPNLRALRAALGKMAFGSPFTVVVNRDGQEVTASAKLPNVEPREAFRRGKPWGSIEATSNGNEFDVRCERVEAFDLFLDEKMVDLDEAIIVRVNGEVVVNRLVEADPAFMFSTAVRDNDRTAVYAANVSVRVPEKK